MAALSFERGGTSCAHSPPLPGSRYFVRANHTFTSNLAIIKILRTKLHILPMNRGYDFEMECFTSLHRNVIEIPANEDIAPPCVKAEMDGKLAANAVCTSVDISLC